LKLVECGEGNCEFKIVLGSDNLKCCRCGREKEVEKPVKTKLYSCCDLGSEGDYSATITGYECGKCGTFNIVDEKVEKPEKKTVRYYLKGGTIIQRDDEGFYVEVSE